MKFLLLALLSTSAFGRQLCISPNSFTELEDILAFAQKCNQNDLVVTPLCKSSAPQGFLTLWSVNNVTPAECEDNSNFSHNLVYNNLKTIWPVGISTICGAFWSGAGQLTLNVSGNNNHVSIDGASDCTPQQKTLAIGLCGQNPLPVTIASFSAQFDGKKCVNVAFTTATEAKSDNVQIERSTDGKNFSMIAGGQIASNSPNGGKYSAKDCEDKIKGTYYYRLKQNDVDGKSELLNVLAVNVSKTTFETSMFPNPTSDELNVKFDTTGLELINYAIYNAAGKLVTKEKVQVEKLSQGFKIPVRNQTNGVYTLKLTNDKNQEIHNGKFIKE